MIEVKGELKVVLDEAQIEEIMVKTLKNDTKYHLDEVNRLDYLISDDAVDDNRKKSAEQEMMNHEFYLKSCLGVLSYYLSAEDMEEFEKSVGINT